MSSHISWVRVNEEVYPQCSKCGSYPLSFKGFLRIEGVKKYRYYMLECGNCGRVYARKTSINELRRLAMKRWL